MPQQRRGVFLFFLGALAQDRDRMRWVSHTSLTQLTTQQSSQLERIGGGEGTRTHDPLVANQVLYQLSYAPIVSGNCSS